MLLRNLSAQATIGADNKRGMFEGCPYLQHALVHVELSGGVEWIYIRVITWACINIREILGKYQGK